MWKRSAEGITVSLTLRELSSAGHLAEKTTRDRVNYQTLDVAYLKATRQANLFLRKVPPSCWNWAGEEPTFYTSPVKIVYGQEELSSLAFLNLFQLF